MVVVTGIKEVAKIAIRAYAKGKAMDRKYRYLDPTNKFIQKYVPPRYRSGAFRIKRYADIAIGGGLIYDLLNVDYDAQISSPPGKNRQTRSNFQRSRFKQFGKPKCYPESWRRRRR